MVCSSVNSSTKRAYTVARLPSISVYIKGKGGAYLFHFKSRSKLILLYWVWSSEEDNPEMGKQCHPLLSGRRKPTSNYSHGFSSAEMESLASVCDTILPSIPFEEKQDPPAGSNKALEYFYKASASQAPIPDEVIHSISPTLLQAWKFEKIIVDSLIQVAEIIVKRGLVEAVILTRVILLILSTKLGTFLLCGSLCWSKKWPFINRFSCMSLENREKVLQKWFKHSFVTPIRVAFFYMKAVCLFVFFSRVINSTLLCRTLLVSFIYLMLAWYINRFQSYALNIVKFFIQNITLTEVVGINL